MKELIEIRNKALKDAAAKLNRAGVSYDSVQGYLELAAIVNQSLEQDLQLERSREGQSQDLNASAISEVYPETSAVVAETEESNDDGESADSGDTDNRPAD